MKRSWRRTVSAICVLGLMAAGCGDDADEDDDATTTTAGRSVTTTTTSADEAAGTVLDLTITESGIEGLPAETPGGVVTVMVGADPEGSPDTEVDFSLVADGTTEDEFREGLATIVSGEAFPEFFQNNAGVGIGESTIELPPGSYFVWTEPSAPEEEEEEEGGEEEGPTPDSFLVTELTVTQAEGDDELPETGGSITATDYAFEVDVAAGDTFTFRNDSPEQFHHAIVFNFGTIDAATVEENLPAFLQSEEDDAPPPGFEEVDFSQLEAGASGVFGPGLGGTATATFAEGNTYAAVCFIQDRAGGPPHAFAYDMYEVFQVE